MWSISKVRENSFQYFERKILRRVCSPVNENDILRKRFSQEIYILFKDIDISYCMKLTRLRWVELLIMKQNNEISKIRKGSTTWQE